MARLSNEHLYFDALWVKVMRTLFSPELVWASYNAAVSLCCILWNVRSLSLSRISSFKRSWELLTGVSTCLYDLSITWSWNTISEEQLQQIFHYKKTPYFWGYNYKNQALNTKFDATTVSLSLPYLNVFSQRCMSGFKLGDGFLQSFLLLLHLGLLFLRQVGPDLEQILYNFSGL